MPGGRELKEFRTIDDMLSIPRGGRLRAWMLKEAKRLKVRPDEIASYWWNLATADARELLPKRNCRYCWGVDHQYQFTVNEFRAERTEHLKVQMARPEEQRVPFDGLGGDGFLRTRDPCPDCPECGGVGVFDISSIDLNKISFGAALLFDGVKVAKDGSVEIVLRDRTRAMANLQKLMGYEIERKVVVLKTFDPSQLSDDELDQEIARLKTLDAAALPAPKIVDA